MSAQNDLAHAIKRAVSIAIPLLLSACGPSAADVEAANLKSFQDGVTKGAADALASCEAVNADDLADATAVNALAARALACVKLIPSAAIPSEEPVLRSLPKASGSAVEMAVAQTETKEVKDARKALIKAGGKMVDATVEVDRKASTGVEQSVKDALLDRPSTRASPAWSKSSSRSTAARRTAPRRPRAAASSRPGWPPPACRPLWFGRDWCRRARSPHACPGGADEHVRSGPRCMSVVGKLSRSQLSRRTEPT